MSLFVLFGYVLFWIFGIFILTEKEKEKKEKTQKYQWNTLEWWTIKNIWKKQNDE